MKVMLLASEACKTVWPTNIRSPNVLVQAQNYSERCAIHMQHYFHESSCYQPVRLLTHGPHKVAPTSKPSALLLITYNCKPQGDQATWIKSALK